MYDSCLYLGKDSHNATDDVTATHATVTHLTCWVESIGQKLFMDFSSITKTFRWLRDKVNKLMQYSTPKQNTWSLTLGQKNWNWKGESTGKNRGGFTVLVWKNRWEVYTLTNINPPPGEENLRDSNCHVKTHIVDCINWHMGYVNNSDRMGKSYSMSHCSFKCP